ncbi:MAG TPA: 50S ribosomal protein L25/general stress protein Ctc [Gemmatimonadaceae bacterium]|nr:50S ribosomal protein L25/general stress protein Ctc [Gemmatimonadaceae bacterium]
MTARLSAMPRQDAGKGVARKLRGAGRVPGVIYGHARDTQPLSVETLALEKLLSHIAAASTVVELDLDGKSSRTLIREIQRHPFKKQILHIDFLELVAGEKVTVSVPLVFVGTAAGVKAGGILDQVMHELELHCDPADIPNHIDIDVSALEIGKSVHVGDIPLPATIEVLADPDATVCVVSAPKAAPEPEPAEVVEAPAEPELIRKTKDEEEAGE